MTWFPKDYKAVELAVKIWNIGTYVPDRHIRMLYNISYINWISGKWCATGIGLKRGLKIKKYIPW